MSDPVTAAAAGIAAVELLAEQHPEIAQALTSTAQAALNDAADPWRAAMRHLFRVFAEKASDEFAQELSAMDQTPWVRAH